MAKEYYERLSNLITELGIDSTTGLAIEIKHFFNGAALYLNGSIRVSLSPVGLAFKLSQNEVDQLISSGHAIPLQYFPKGPIKKSYALFEAPDFRQPKTWKNYFIKAIYTGTESNLQPISLNEKLLLEGILYLCKIDLDLNKIVSNLGNPPLWGREPGFPTLVHIILEQQVSLASAKAAFTKLETAAGDLIPERFIEFSDVELRAFGFSRQKTEYCRGMSSAILNGDLDLDRLQSLDDITVRNALMTINGIGPWTADIYLLMALLRPDIWPSGDLALAKAVQTVKHLSEKPSPELLDEISEGWKPYRAVAARILWNHYLNGEN